ncbi:MAG: CapA family protein [Solirubrobacteraceae bacterium]|nr:CapA family protein [Solirubrobacteraceae bacterium]
MDRPSRPAATTTATLAVALSALLAVPSPAVPSTPRSARPATTPPRTAVPLTIVAGGDLLVHGPVWRAAWSAGAERRYAFARLLAPISPTVRRAHVAICHLETPLTPGPPRGYPTFRTPTALADGVRRTGYDVCTTASNHSLDAGTHGITTTRRAAARAGVPLHGIARSAEERRAIPVVRTRSGVRVAVLSYTESTNGIPLPRPWSVALARPDEILRDARRARARGADAVVVNLHAGDEYRTTPSATQRRLAGILARSPSITAVVGQHAHVPQPITWIAGTPVAYGAGNLLSNQSPGCCHAASQGGYLVRIRSTARRRATGRGFVVRPRRVEYVPTFVTRPGYRVVPALASRATGARESARRTIAIVGRSARIRPVIR